MASIKSRLLDNASIESRNFSRLPQRFHPAFHIRKCHAASPLFLSALLLYRSINQHCPGVEFCESNSGSVITAKRHLLTLGWSCLI
jgi:hypothetical protein